MSAFTINTITIQGINIIAKLIAGSTLEFTKIELGDGQLQGINPQSVTALTNTVVTLPITAVSAADGTATVTGVFTNKDITTGFFYRELGLFAKDPETGEEKLYCYGNAENNAEWIPPSGTETVVEKKIKINTICGNATKVTATLASGIYVTKETVDQEIEIHNKDLGAHEVLFGEYTYYVNGTTGNDNNQGSEDKPLRTITKAVELIPGLAKAATVNIAAGTYNESIIISDKVRGKLSFIGADKDTTKVTSLKAEGNMYLCLMKLTFNSNGTPLRTVEFGCGTVSFSECKFIGNGASQSIGVAIHRANGIIYNCDFTGFNFGLMAAYGSGIFAYFLHCSNNTYDLYSNGGFISTDDNTTLTKFSDYGGIISSYAVGKSIAAGVADSTTDASDSSEKIVTTKYLRKAGNPVGAVISYGGIGLPAGYLPCDGSAVSRTTYKELFTAIGTTFGTGNGSTTFNVPNLIGKMIQGSGIDSVGTIKAAGLPNIQGVLSYIGATTAAYVNHDGALQWLEYQTPCNVASVVTTRNSMTDIGLDASKSNAIYGASTTVQPPAVVLRYVIKY